MQGLRRVQFIKEQVLAERGLPGREVTRVAAVAVIANPFAGRDVEDLTPLADLGSALGDRLAPEALALLGRPAMAYGKAAIVGVSGEIEHTAGLLHPSLGRSMRSAIGGQALVPSSAKIGGPGSVIDVPLGHKDDGWSFGEIDTMSVFVSSSPSPDEIALVIAFADGCRQRMRISGLQVKE